MLAGFVPHLYTAHFCVRCITIEFCSYKYCTIVNIKRASEYSLLKNSAPRLRWTEALGACHLLPRSQVSCAGPTAAQASLVWRRTRAWGVRRATLLSRGPQPSLGGPWVGPVQSRGTNNWYPHYSEVKVTSLLKYKLTPLNYYFLFVTTFIY